MTQNQEVLIKELLYRSEHRGCKETDILLGEFAAASLVGMSDELLKDYAELIAHNDANIFAWLTGQMPYPANLNHELLEQIKIFHQNKHERN